MVHDEEVALVGDDSVEVATEEVGLVRRVDFVVLAGPPIKLEAEAQFHRWHAIGHDVGLNQGPKRSITGRLG